MKNISLMVVNPNFEPDLICLYNLLAERKPWQSISHKQMPTFEAHKAFVQSKPYKMWYLIYDGHEVVGSTYFSKQNEIGIFIFKAYQGRGYATEAIKQLMDDNQGPFYANINPVNKASKELFTKLGFTQCQVTYVRD